MEGNVAILQLFLNKILVFLYCQKLKCQLESNMPNKGKGTVAHNANTDRWAAGFKNPISKIKKTQT